MRASFCLALLAACGGGSSAVAPATPSTSTPGDTSSATAPTTPTAPAKPAGPPVARTVDTVDEQFGLRVPDPYRWMEGNDNKERDAWMLAHAAHAAAHLERLPGREELLGRIRALGGDVASSGNVQLAGGRTFFYDTAAGASLPVLKVRDADGKERVLVDPATVEASGGHAALNSYSVSPDGEIVAYDISTGGSEVSSIKLITVDTGAHLPDEVPMVWGEFPAYWLADGSGFFYTQMVTPPPGGDPIQNMKGRIHVLGKPVADDVDILVGDRSQSMKFEPQEFPTVYVSPGTAWAVAQGGGARTESRLAVAKLASVDRSGAAATAWRVIAGYDDFVNFQFVHGDRAYMTSFKDTPNMQLVSVALSKPDLKTARVEVAEDPQARITAVSDARDALYYVMTVAGQSTLYRRPWAAKRGTAITLPYAGMIRGLQGDPLRDGVVFAIASWVKPNTFFAYAPKTKKVTPIGIGTQSDADFSGIVAEEVEATSADGTKVPLSILRRADLALDGTHPAIVNGYGGYGFSIDPNFDPTRLAWLERGGVLAYAHVRGGGEKGRRWYLDGKGAKKANGVADFVACGEYLVAKGYSSHRKVAAQGGSMGGVLVGMAITSRPDVFGAANISVGVVNPARLSVADNGSNQYAEVGDPRTEEGFKQIVAMDPYQHVVDGTAYPATIFTVGLNDRRVAPWMTGKMAARMLKATSSGRPVLVRIDTDAGHGVGSTRDQRFREIADVWSFFLSVGGVTPPG
ncbi:MAG TPA: prolyl oligopeptidase family serine peptidase [Kofleriaceae bacterium]|nr:prolyl oligopeptidase family serine peptidase [Kofleriaceae bacterium]